mgnify:CR=1 FL=1
MKVVTGSQLMTCEGDGSKLERNAVQKDNLRPLHSIPHPPCEMCHAANIGFGSGYYSPFGGIAEDVEQAAVLRAAARSEK